MQGKCLNSCTISSVSFYFLKATQLLLNQRVVESTVVASVWIHIFVLFSAILNICDSLYFGKWSGLWRWDYDWSQIIHCHRPNVSDHFQGWASIWSQNFSCRNNSTWPFSVSWWNVLYGMHWLWLCEWCGSHCGRRCLPHFQDFLLLQLGNLIWNFMRWLYSEGGKWIRLLFSRKIKKNSF